MFRTSLIPLALIVFTMSSPGQAQEAAAEARRASFPGEGGQVAASGIVTPTVEMWFYEQERLRHEDPKMAVRQKAEMRAQQRQGRLAAMRWYGIDNSRPMVSPTPSCSGYSAYWGSNSYEPLRWRPMTPVIVVARPTAGPY